MWYVRQATGLVNIETYLKFHTALSDTPSDICKCDLTSGITDKLQETQMIWTTAADAPGTLRLLYTSSS